MTPTDKIMLVDGDIARLAVDAVVNAANSSLLGGGGVDGAIHRAAGPGLLEECRGLGGCPAGQAKISAGYQLPARYVIHTVGPVWHGGGEGEPEILISCYQSCFKLARQHGIATIAFPAIATGAYGFPGDRAAVIAVQQARLAIDAFPDLEKIYFVCFGGATKEAYQQALTI